MPTRHTLFFLFQKEGAVCNAFNKTNLPSQFMNLQHAVLDLVWVVLGSTRVAIVLVRSNLAIAETNAWAMLPYFAGLALDHDALMVYSSTIEVDTRQRLMVR